MGCQLSADHHLAATWAACTHLHPDAWVDTSARTYTEVFPAAAVLCCAVLPLQPVQPMCVNGRQLAPDELAVCELCGSDEEGAAAPKWQVQKKQHVIVDL
jgi:hypothetical protein